jgi:hypothetical protein
VKTIAFTIALCAAAIAHADPPAKRTPPPPLPPGTVDLLTYESSEVAVSSTVANKKILPAALVDGDLETAWNSRTNELAGVWIGIHLPSFAHVSAVRITAGFTHVEGDADWFTMNPRIAKIRISQAGRLIAERALDVANRGLQAIAFDAVANGGDLSIDVVEVTPGSKKDWREVSISELQVLGTLSLGQKRKAPLAVQVGGLPAAYNRPPPAVAEYKPPAIPQLVLPARAGDRVIVVLDRWLPGVVLRGAPAVIDPGVVAKMSGRAPALLQPIDEPPGFAAKPWSGRALTMYGSRGKVCDGAVEGLGIVVDGKGSPSKAPPTADDIATAWRDQRENDRMLVAIVRAKTDCAGALWAQAPEAHAPRYGTIEKKRLRAVIHARYFDARDDGYARLEEHYQLNDLNGEYENAEQNEAKIPKDERLSPKLVDKTWRSFAACDAAGGCIGAAIGDYNGHVVARAYAIAKDTVTDSQGLDGHDIGDPLAAADVDGDGDIELVYATAFGIGVFGRGVQAVAQLYDE